MGSSAPLQTGQDQEGSLAAMHTEGWIIGFLQAPPHQCGPKGHQKSYDGCEPEEGKGCASICVELGAG